MSERTKSTPSTGTRRNQHRVNLGKCARECERKCVRDWSRIGSGSRSRLVEFQDEELAVGMEGAAGGGLGFFHGFFGEEMRDFCYEAGGRESFLDVVTLEVDVRIDLVSDPVVALVALESDVVSSGTDPVGGSRRAKRRE